MLPARSRRSFQLRSRSDRRSPRTWKPAPPRPLPGGQTVRPAYTAGRTTQNLLPPGLTTPWPTDGSPAFQDFVGGMSTWLATRQPLGRDEFQGHAVDAV